MEIKLTRFDHLHARKASVVVVAHVFHTDVAQQLARYLSNVIVPYDLIVTTPLEDSVEAIVSAFSAGPESILVAVTENRGRDIGPFTAVYCSGLLDDYDAALKIHTKKSSYSPSGHSWRRDLLDDLLGTSNVVLKSIELLMSGKIGMVGPARFYLTNPRYWGSNRKAVGRLLSEPDPELGFFAGSMFWFRPDALAFLKSIPELESSFETESGQRDATMAHAIERAFCSLARRSGYIVSALDIGGADIGQIDTTGNTTPVG